MNNFIAQLKNAGFRDIEQMTIGNRSDREYFSAYLPDRSRVFIKHQIHPDGMKQIAKERAVLQVLHRKTIDLPNSESLDYVICDYYKDYRTLRELIEFGISPEEEDYVGLCIVGAFESFSDTVEAIYNALIPLESEDWCRKLRMHYIKLMMSSGWWGVARWRTIIREYLVGYSSYLIALPYRLKLKKYNAISYISHGDFHWGNILCGTDDIKIIDVENVMCGDPNMDVAYLYCRLEHHLRGNPAMMDYLNEGLRRFQQTRFYDSHNYSLLYKLFSRAIKWNPKFK